MVHRILAVLIFCFVIITIMYCDINLVQCYIIGYNYIIKINNFTLELQIYTHNIHSITVLFIG